MQGQRRPLDVSEALLHPTWRPRRCARSHALPVGRRSLLCDRSPHGAIIERGGAIVWLRLTLNRWMPDEPSGVTVALGRRLEATLRAAVRWGTEGDVWRSGRKAQGWPERAARRRHAASRLLRLRSRATEYSHTNCYTRPDRGMSGSDGLEVCDPRSEIRAHRALAHGSKHRRLRVRRGSWPCQPCLPCQPHEAWGTRVRYRARRSRSRTMRPRLRPTRGTRTDVASGFQFNEISDRPHKKAGPAPVRGRPRVALVHPSTLRLLQAMCAISGARLAAHRALLHA
jgi:hypothetical protein